MALPNFLLVFIFLSSIQVLSYGTISTDHNQTIQAMLIQTCYNIENQSSCLSNIQARLENQNPNSILKAALETTLNEARQAMGVVTKFNTLSISPREQIAIQDCQELLDFSVSELAWSLTEMNKIRAGSTNFHYEGDLKAWLSAALSNQDTCLEGFEGTDRRLERTRAKKLLEPEKPPVLEKLLEKRLEEAPKVANSDQLRQLHSLPFKPSRNNTKTNQAMEYPKWVTEGDKDLLAPSPNGMHVDAVVALDGSGHYRSIIQAVNEAPNYSNRRYIIYIKKGVYRENIDMKKKKTNIMFVGDGIGATVVTGDRNFRQGWTTFRTATVAVSGRGFIARDMTFRNTAGPQSHQAVALRVDSDQSAFFRCSMEGYQDTLYIHSLRQFYRECNIHGTIDFIFGNGAAVLQNCKIFTRQPLPMQKVTITAQGRKDPHQSTGFSIQDSYVYATMPTYLGRPWKQYSRTVYLNTYMSGLVQPRGWLEWYGDFALSTLWYGEYRNYGPGSSLSGRVQWPGYHIIRDAAAANFFTAGRFIDGRSWLPHTGIKFTAGLTN
ncbi:hypothetical protein TEA_008018 [Camellia sinensis var. sinensis]|uniref:Pectinesterase n=1 Tax=Camellia sinensis var. sinensis TaxID=542762 RepID=A0A4S4DT67_CAMSN|nr:hypothetical protein TEA_008018 [Camellia sinensis var. sinensis]